jgi:hypothetical protein
MNATKRKFNALLNGIGNKSTTSLSKELNNVSAPDSTTTDLDDDNMWKRRRFARPTSTIITVANPEGLTTVTTRSSHKKAVSHATNIQPAEPKYAPWDRAAFLNRLKSFSNLTDWTPKPARVTEVEWAKRGWVCQKLERVRCSLCNVEILVKLNKKEVNGKEEPIYVAQNIEDALVDKYVELIITSHNEDCLWRKRGCDDTIFKLPLNDAPTTLDSLRERYNELCQRKDTLPYEFNLRLPDSFSLETILTYLPPNFFTTLPNPTSSTPPQTPELNKTALTLALFGWQGHTHPRLGVQLGSVSCNACFRVLGLWLFKSKVVSAEGVEIEGPVVNCLNPAKEHREYCPWRNAVSQNGVGKSSTNNLAGWEVLLRTLKNEFYLRGGAGVERPLTAGSAGSGDGVDLEEVDEEEERRERAVKDKERWARLRRVKSLFDTKAGKKLQGTLSGKSKAADDAAPRKKVM